MTPERDIIEKAKRGLPISAADICTTIFTEAELESFKAGMKHHGRLTGEALTAIEKRRHQLQKAKGVSWRS